MKLQDGYDIATVNGIATADANGEMTFEPLEHVKLRET